MALVPLHDGTWHLTEPDEVWGGVRAHYLDETLEPDAARAREQLARALEAYGLRVAHHQPVEHRYVLVETKSIPS